MPPGDLDENAPDLMALLRLPQLKPRERLLAAVSGMIVLALVLDRIVLNPWLRHARTVRQEIHRMEEALQTHQRLLARQERVTAELKRHARYLQPPIADDLQMAALLKEVQSLAGDSQIQVNEIKPLATEQGGGSKRYALEVRFECTLDEWVDFIHRLETSPSLYEVIRAGLATQEDVPEKLQGYLRVVSAVIAPDAPGSQPAPPPKPKPGAKG